MAKKVQYRGKTPEELREMTADEISKLLKSRARRSLKRASARYRKLIEKVRKAEVDEKKEKIIKTHLRDAVILPDWVGLKFGIHNGKEFKTIEMRIEMVGHRLGEFAHTTGRVAHSGPGVGATRGSKFIPLK
ncbi:MAG: 30S ribosomal protein S19 [Candidatus Micrarchaeota archaeon]|nr:30S ribosomal protein S19 [Candidatus Micrarchaeota archaeon]